MAGRPMSTPKLDATYIRPGHEIRRPGESEWLTVDSAAATTIKGHQAIAIFCVGGRMFVTLPETPWPCRVPEVVS